jgi:hypothetical protein
MCLSHPGSIPVLRQIANLMQCGVAQGSVAPAGIGTAHEWRRSEAAADLQSADMHAWQTPNS